MRTPPPAAALEHQLLRALPPLYQRTRQGTVRSLALRLQALRQVRNLESSALVLALVEVLDRLHLEVTGVEAEQVSLLRRYARARDPATQRAVLQAHLKETATDGATLRADLAALDRWLGIDTLRERLDRRRQVLLIEEELGLRCIAGVLRARNSFLADAAGTRHAGLILLDRALGAPRLQNQLAGAEAIRELLRAARAPVLAAVPDIPMALESVIDHGDAHPFVQAEALAALQVADPARGLLLLRARLERPGAARLTKLPLDGGVSPEDWGDPPREWKFQEGRDFLFRRHVLELTVPGLPEDERLALLGHVLRADPSEHVRMGACQLLVGPAGRLRLLQEAAGLALPREESAKVRASAVLAMTESARRDPGQLPVVLDTLARVLADDASDLVLRVCCEQAAGVTALLAEGGVLPGADEGDRPRATVAPIDSAQLNAAAAPVVQALAALRLRSSGVVLETAAAAEQSLRRSLDPVRRAWTRHLWRLTRDIPSGGSARLLVEPPPEGLPPLPEEPEWLGAVLADLSSGGLGLYARRHGHLLKLWRGDRFTRRAWRLWHELRRPTPNKRQGFAHTVGRSLPGTLRAHPARMEEVTETQVPGERVYVPSEGGWARHLPTVDDLLDLPVGDGEAVQVFSSHGVTTLRPPPSLWRRLTNRLRLSVRYRDYAGLRLASLSGNEPRQRRRYVERVRRELGVEVDFEPYQQGEAIPAKLGTLFDAGAGRLQSVLLALIGLPGWLVQARERLLENEPYFLSMDGNGLAALALFTAALFTGFLWSAFSRRKAVRQSRATVPLCIGGWGTRGKSGTERLKAALLGGLGFDVFAKTTGSEAMFVHSAPGAPPAEFFIYRPYDKATIWEQKDMLELGSRLGTEVFLWECMALQPGFVELLQNDWMRDDLATLTNAYPDHEDIQGPAGQDVAQVISRFMPNGRTVITTEDHFLPLFEEEARARGTRLLHSPWYEAELIADEVLEQFPYREHPRNMALVATLGEQLGINRTLALGLMAEYVQPEIGVLKVFPEVRVRGRLLTFINGHSANERTGFLNNWLRTGLDRLDPESAPDRAVVTVINNRWDRVSRSEVFARILVEDAPADRHVLIGTNLVGLRKYLHRALESHLARVEVVTAEDLDTPRGAQQASTRLAQQLLRLKIPRPSVDLFLGRLAHQAHAAGHALLVPVELRADLAAVLRGNDDELRVDRVRLTLESRFAARLEAALVGRAAVAEPAANTPPEVLHPPTPEEVREHALYLLARMVVHARLQRRVPRDLPPEERQAALALFHREFRAAYQALFLEQVITVDDPLATGDQVVEACARAVGPGMQVSIMGAQNIKGTGLDWVYRWLTLDRVATALRTLAASTAAAARHGALESLEAVGDAGLLDSGLCSQRLPALVATARTPEEAERLQRLADAARATHAAKLSALENAHSGNAGERAIRVVENALDYLDSVRRRRLSELLLEDLVAGRVSHHRAAIESRRLYERGKGGWIAQDLDGLARTLRRWLSPRPRVEVPAPEPVLPNAEPQPLLRSEFLRALTARGDSEISVPVVTSGNSVSGRDAENVRAPFDGEDDSGKPQA